MLHTEDHVGEIALPKLTSVQVTRTRLHGDTADYALGTKAIFHPSLLSDFCRVLLSTIISHFALARMFVSYRLQFLMPLTIPQARDGPVELQAICCPDSSLCNRHQTLGQQLFGFIRWSRLAQFHKYFPRNAKGKYCNKRSPSNCYFPHLFHLVGELHSGRLSHCKQVGAFLFNTGQDPLHRFDDGFLRTWKKDNIGPLC
jgi:hypothetical protein